MRRSCNCGNDENRTTQTSLDEPLSENLQSALSGFAGVSITSLADWADHVREHTGGAIGVEDLCHTDAPSPHQGIVGDDTYHFVCFYDAAILAGLMTTPVDIRTESPDGAVIEARATGDDLVVDPETAVFSFGVDPTMQPDDPTPGDVYAAICPYIKAFPDRTAYEDWADSIDVPTVALPLAGATNLAERLVA